MKHIKTFEIISPVPLWIAYDIFNPNKNKSSSRKIDKDYVSSVNPIKKAFRDYPIKSFEKDGFKFNNRLTEARKKIGIFTIIVNFIDNNYILTIKKNVDKVLLKKEYTSFYVLLKDYMKQYEKVKDPD